MNCGMLIRRETQRQKHKLFCGEGRSKRLKFVVVHG